MVFLIWKKIYVDRKSCSFFLVQELVALEKKDNGSYNKDADWVSGNYF